MLSMLLATSDRSIPFLVLHNLIDFVNSNREVTTLDKIVCVTCALITMYDSVVLFD